MEVSGGSCLRGRNRVTGISSPKDALGSGCSKMSTLAARGKGKKINEGQEFSDRRLKQGGGGEGEGVLFDLH